MALSRVLPRLVSAILLICVVTTCTAQSVAAPEARIAPDILKRLQASQKETGKITLIETDGTRVHGVVTDLQTDYVSITIRYGQPSVHVPYDRIDHIDSPPLTKHAKVVLGVVVTASVIGIIFLVTAMAKHA